MKQRVGIAMALLGNPRLLILDEPLNGLDADGMRIMRKVFTDIIKDGKRSILVSSHLLGELQKVATHYGIIRHGKMIREMTAEELDASCRTYVIKKGYNPLRPITATLPGDSWGIDLAGPLKTSLKGNNYLLIMVDIATRFCVLRPIPDKPSMTIVKELARLFRRPCPRRFSERCHIVH